MGEQVAVFRVPEEVVRQPQPLPVPVAAAAPISVSGLQTRRRYRQAGIRPKPKVRGGATTRTDLSAQQKVDLCTALQTAFTQEGLSKRQAWKRFADEFKLHPRS